VKSGDKQESVPNYDGRYARLFVSNRSHN